MMHRIIVVSAIFTFAITIAAQQYTYAAARSILDPLYVAAPNRMVRHNQITPSNAVQVPGRIEMEAYQDFYDVTPGNLFAAEAPDFQDDVDVRPTADQGGGYKIADIAPFEWLTYELTATETTTYTLIARIASDDDLTAKSFQIIIDEGSENQIGPLTAQPTLTGGWDQFINLTIGEALLTEGPHTMVVVMDTGWFDINYIEITDAPPRGNSPGGTTFLPIVNIPQ